MTGDSVTGLGISLGSIPSAGECKASSVVLPSGGMEVIVRVPKRVQRCVVVLHSVRSSGLAGRTKPPDVLFFPIPLFSIRCLPTLWRQYLTKLTFPALRPTSRPFNFPYPHDLQLDPRSPSLAPPPVVDPTTGQPAPPPIEKSFLQKYWMPMLGLAVFSISQLAPDPPRAAGASGGGGGAR